MISVIRGEIQKIRRPIYLILLSGAVIAPTLLFTFLLFLKKESRADLVTMNGVLGGVKLAGLFIGIISLCIFASNFAQEYTFGTIKNILTRHPNRITLFAGKLLTQGLLMGVLIWLSILLSLIIAFMRAHQVGLSTNKWMTFSAFGSIFQVFGNLWLATLYFGLLGASLGTILKSPIITISASTIWIVVLETVLTSLLPKAGNYLPGQSISSISQGGHGYLRELLVATAYVGSTCFCAVTIFQRRDITG
jgi:ABC-2 type transport system permease protein